MITTNFDAAMFLDPTSTGYGVVICNSQTEVMASFSINGPPAVDSDKTKLLACQRAIEFAFEVKFMDIVIEGDNAHFDEVPNSPRSSWFSAWTCSS